ncbi:MAG: hypothetical protein COA42_07730 [Alteromonadaceae bacterium]|nr:MAG: hypothetical protein COA42_07730 [Alteromonadaceae bacterium]
MSKSISLYILIILMSFSINSASADNKLGTFKTSLSTMLVFSIPETLKWNPLVPKNISGVDFLENEIDVNISQEAIDTKAFISERFGIDVDLMLAQGRVNFGLWELNQNVLCRARVLNGANIPEEGLPLRAGGHTLVVTDPAGIVMGGEFDGVVLEAGAAVGKGYWTVTEKNNQKLRLGWKSKIPLHRPLLKTPLFYTDVWDLDSTQVGTGAGIDTIKFNDDFTFTPILRQVVELHTPEA